jgi:hypothetical protein
MAAVTIRWVIPTLIFITGQVILAATGDWVSWAGFTGGALAVILVSLLMRIGIEGNRERDREEAAREYFTEHGVWPDGEDDSSPPPAASGAGEASA